jgi:hypothetical protein
MQSDKKDEDRRVLTPLFKPLFIGILLTWVGVAYQIKVGMQSRFWGQRLDSAGLVDYIHLNSIYFTQYSEVWASPGTIWELFGTSSQNWCEQSYTTTLNIFKKNTFLYHPYVFGILQGAVIRYFGFETLNFVLWTFALFFSMFIVFVVYTILKSKIHILSKISIIVAFLIYPPILQAFQGELYFDRLLIPLGALLFYMAWEILYTKSKFKLLRFIFIYLITTSISERGSFLSVLILTGILLYALFMNRHKIHKFNLTILTILNCFNIFYFVYWTLYVQESPYYGNYTNSDILSIIYQRIINIDNSRVVYPFLSFILPLFFIFIKKIYFLIFALLIILPNLIITIGGAELDGYSTHYHSLYVGTVWGIVLVALSTSDQRERDSKDWKILSTVTAFVALLLSVFTYNWFNSTGAIKRNLQSVYVYNVLDNENYNFRVSEIKIFTKDLNPNKSISMSEEIGPFIATRMFKEVNLFPAKISSADTVIVVYDENDLPRLYPYHLSDPENYLILQRCIDAKLRKLELVKQLDFGTSKIKYFEKID